MKKFILGLISTLLVSTIGVLWAFSADISSLKTWRSFHTHKDTVMMNTIKEDLRELRDGQQKILHYMLRVEKR